MNEMTVINYISKKSSEITIDDVGAACEKAGVTIDRVCQKLNELLEARRELKDRDGEGRGVYEEEYNVQYKAAMACIELLDLVKKKDVVVGGVIEHQLSKDEREFRERIAEKICAARDRIRLEDTIDV
jgi:UDP-N-acetylmuramyl pentapeptide synthase